MLIFAMPYPNPVTSSPNSLDIANCGSLTIPICYLYIEKGDKDALDF